MPKSPRLTGGSRPELGRDVVDPTLATPFASPQVLLDKLLKRGATTDQFEGTKASTAASELATGTPTGKGSEARLEAALVELRAAQPLTAVHAKAARNAARAALSLDGDWTRASVFLALAKELAPTALYTGKLELEFFTDTKQRDAALALAKKLVAAHPKDIGLTIDYAKLLLDDTRIDEAVAVSTTLAALRRAGGLSVEEVIAAQICEAKVFFRAGRPAEAVQLYRAVLAADAENISAHLGIAELVIPNFAAAHRPRAEALLAEGGKALLAGDAATAKQRATDALALDPNDGMAHKLFVWAKRHTSRAAREAKAGGPKLISAVADPESQRAVIDQLGRIVARAKVGTPARPGTPTDVIPQWKDLSTLHQATVAASILAYGHVLPTLVEQGLRLHLVSPGQTALAVDPFHNLDHKNAFGRHWYAVRGWHRGNEGKGSVIVIGGEKLGDIARGAYNTITHEVAHAVHAYMIRLAADPSRTVHGPSMQQTLGRAAADIEVLYKEAKGRRAGQRLLDAYSGNNSHEYLAQGWMAYLNVEPDSEENNSRRLYGRNPKMFTLCRELTSLLADYPPRVPAPAPEALGERPARSGWSWMVAADASPALKAVAASCRDDLRKLYLFAPAVLSKAVRQRAGELVAAFDKRRRALPGPTDDVA